MQNNTLAVLPYFLRKNTCSIQTKNMENNLLAHMRMSKQAKLINGNKILFLNSERCYMQMFKFSKEIFTSACKMVTSGIWG